MSRTLLFIASFALMFSISPMEVEAQCSMCKAVVESNANAETLGIGAQNVSGRINTGILYLMGMVYTILLTVAYLVFKDQINEKLRAMRGKA